MLALGGRASADSLRHGAERAEITATFETGKDAAIRQWLDEQSIDAGDGEIVLRRVIGNDGRSRQYVNGQSLPAESVRELGEMLIDIHGQQEFQTLVSRDAQRGIVDGHGPSAKLTGSVTALAAEWRAITTERELLAALARDRSARLELLRYQVGELEALGLQSGEAGALLEERLRLANRGRLADAAQGRSRSAMKATARMPTHSPLAPRLPCARRRHSTHGSQRPCSSSRNRSLRSGSRVQGSAPIWTRSMPTRRATRPSNAASPRSKTWHESIASNRRSCPASSRSLRSQLQQLEQSERVLDGLDGRIAGVRKSYDAAAAELTAARRAAARRLGTSVTSLMRQLGMPGGKFEIAIETDPARDPESAGADRVEFLVSANPGEPPKPVAKVASGGELSRISLAVQVAAANRNARAA